MADMFAQGPHYHCGDTPVHDKHQTPIPGYPTAWCSGVPVLPPFVEVTVRVPLVEYFGEDSLPSAAAGDTHESVFSDLRESSPSILAWLGDMEGSEAAFVVRLRASGEDRYYHAVEGEWPSGQRSE